MEKLFSIVSLLLVCNILIAQWTNTNPNINNTNTGNVGIGTTTPAYKLDVSSAGTTTLKIGSTSSSTMNANLILGGDNGSNHGFWKFSKSPTTFTGELALSYNNGAYGGDHKMMTIYANSDGSSPSVVIGTNPAILNGCTLAVDGKIGARALVISNLSPFPDYVFGQGYKLLPLSELEKFIKQYSHLPEMPSAEDVKKDGLEIGELTTILVEKIEELTLHIIQTGKQVEKLQKENEEINAKLQTLSTK